MNYTEQINQNLQSVHERFSEAALRAGRDPAEVQLVAVSKTFSTEAVLAAWACGQRNFGENRAGEGAEKRALVAKKLNTDDGPVWHMIGHIQRRKAQLVIDNFDVVHSVDRLALAEKLNRLTIAADRKLPVLIECNVSGEESKYGYAASGWEKDQTVREELIRELEAVVELPGLAVQGLMTMAPIVEDMEDARPIFASLRHLLHELQEKVPAADWKHLSMGMTDDFEVAVEEGATMIRIGRAIFGARTYR